MAKIKDADVEVITFKMDRSVKKAMRGIKNRSEFIRSAILAALDHVCPFCQGTGVLTPHRKKHWNELVGHHKMKECGDCHENVFVCRP
jgi:hypothetical protein